MIELAAAAVAAGAAGFGVRALRRRRWDRHVHDAMRLVYDEGPCDCRRRATGSTPIVHTSTVCYPLSEW